jgi:hypothetical protein
MHNYKVYFRFFPLRCKSPQWARASSLWRLHDHTQVRHTTPLDEWSARRRDLYLTTPNIHNRETSTAPGGIRTHNRIKRAAADPRLSSRGRWDRPALDTELIQTSVWNKSNKSWKVMQDAKDASHVHAYLYFCTMNPFWEIWSHMSFLLMIFWE